MEIEEARKIISNEELKSAMNEIYNNWFNRYKNIEILSNKDFSKIFEEAKQIMAKYNYVLVHRILWEFVEELDRRTRENEANKPNK